MQLFAIQYGLSLEFLSSMIGTRYHAVRVDRRCRPSPPRSSVVATAGAGVVPPVHKAAT
jgi:hypothetical protein